VRERERERERESEEGRERGGYRKLGLNLICRKFEG
jgi:ribosomal protein S14